jgi:hypothetical protein
MIMNIQEVLVIKGLRIVRFKLLSPAYLEEANKTNNSMELSTTLEATSC